MKKLFSLRANLPAKKSKTIYCWLLCLFTLWGFVAHAQDPCSGNCVSFNGSGYIDCGSSTLYNNAQAITVEAWVYPTAWAGGGKYSTIVGRNSGGAITAASTNFWLMASATGITGYVSNGTTISTASTGATLTLNQWNHIALVWQSGGTPRLYWQGGTMGIGSALTGGLPGNSNPIRIGSSSGSNEGGFFGSIDDVRIYNVALTDAELNQYVNRFNSATNPLYNNLLGYWRFQEGTGTNTVNQSPLAGNVSLLTGAVSWTGSLQPCNTFDLLNTSSLNQQNYAINKIDINWSYPYNYPVSSPLENAGSLSFRVYRDNVVIATVPHTAGVNTQYNRSFTYSDASITKCQYSYDIEPVWINGATVTSAGRSNTIIGRTTDINFAATKGAYATKTVLSWNNIAANASGGFEIWRSGQQIAQLTNPNQTSYNDLDGIPGMPYEYEIRPLPTGAASRICKDTGYIQANGRLSGYVKSPLQAGVPGVLVTAIANIGGSNYSYSEVTDASGFYEIRNVFYNTLATYTITPSKGTHQFNPASLQRTLDVLAYNAPQANFTDTSVFTVGGKITFPNQLSQPGCAAAGVKVLINGFDRGVVTNANGDWSFVITDEANYSFTPVYKNHTFLPASRAIFVSGNATSLNFSNTTTEVLHLSVNGYCNTQVCDNSAVKVSGIGIGGCYDQTFPIPGNGELVVTLPAQKYLVTIDNVFDALDANNASKVKLNSLPFSHTVDLSKRDTSSNDIVTATLYITGGDMQILPNGDTTYTPADTSYTYDTTTVITTPEAQARFVYGGEFDLLVQGLDTLQPCGKVLLEQGNLYPLRIDIFRKYKYQNFTSYCRLDSGTLMVYDDIADTNFVSYTIDSGIVRYQVKPGKPNISPSGPHPYQKFLVLNVNGLGAVSISQTYWATVLGNRQLTSTFVTKTPELPFFVLHDPPGDASSATLEKGTSFTYNYSNSVESSWGIKQYIKLKTAAEIAVPFTGIVFANGGSAQFTMESNNTKTSNKSVNTTITTVNAYSTSSNAGFIGEDADIVVGASLNLIYGLSYILDYDSLNCTGDVDTALTWGANDFATTYMYTIGHIKNTLIPQFIFLHDFYARQGSDSALIYQKYINVWSQVVEQNHQNILESEFIENRSFSGGVSYSNSSSAENSKGLSINYETSLDNQVAAALNLGTDNNKLISGTEVNFGWTIGKSTDTETADNREVSYTLSDGDAGDFFSVDIRNDKVYATPTFLLVAGTSSCPHEEGTQQRDMPEVQVINPIQQNVPVTSQAVFTVQMSNFSESNETRSYEVIIDPNSNLDGAVVRLGGQLISQFPASFTIPANQSITATLSVEKGPVAIDYNNLKLVMYAACDHSISDETEFTVGYQSNCPAVTLYTPSNNWLVNTQKNTLDITYGGFNANDTSLAQIGLEIRVGSTWNIIPSSIVTLQQLQQNNNPYYSVNLNMSGFADGAYDIRAYSICNTQPPVKSYSATLSGVIDYTSITLFGTPSPADGVLNYGEDISVAFNEPLDCGRVFNLQNLVYDSVTLRRTDNGLLIPCQYVCSGSSLVITTSPPSLIDGLQNISLTARVKNIYGATGNVLSIPVEWSFVVNRSKQYWSPSSLSISLEQNATQNVSGSLKNEGAASATYTLTKVPAWMNIASTTGNIAAGNIQNLSFGVNASLNPGTYTDTVIADFGGGNLQLLFVNLQVRYAAPYWSVNASAFQYNMGVIANFSTTALNAPLSTDGNDKIAVFAGNQCRGVANISYEQVGNIWRAFITVHSNSISGEQLHFRMWDASTGTEYEAMETASFVNNALLGSQLAPMILHPAGVVQRIPVAQGWNWFSLNVINTDMSVSNMLKYVIADSAMIVKTDNQYAQYSKTQKKWAGSLATLGYQKSYMIFMSHADTLQFVGNRLKDTATVSFASGWNWVPYPQFTIQNTGSYMSSFVAASNDILKSQTQFATYSGNAWSGSLTQLNPGQGYKLQTANGGTVQVLPERALPGWSVSEFDYEYNMNITAVLQVNGVESTGGYLIGAFINNTCVGVRDIQNTGSYARIFMTLHGNTASNNQPIEFRVYSYADDSTYAPAYTAINYAADGQNGSLESPFVLSINVAGTSIAHYDAKGYALYQNMPNPFNNQTVIRFVIPQTEPVTIDVYDYTGRLIRTIANGNFVSGEHTLQFNPDELSAGIYFYRMYAGDFSATRKMRIE